MVVLLMSDYILYKAIYRTKNEKTKLATKYI